LTDAAVSLRIARSVRAFGFFSRLDVLRPLRKFRRRALNERPRKPQPDPLRKIRFREAARDIIAKDRYDRRDGRAVDTAGAVADIATESVPGAIEWR
jgi:hypothetical protein